MPVLAFVQAAVNLRETIDEAQADMIAKALCLGPNAPATQAAKDQFDAALDEQLLNICLADFDYWEDV